MDSMIQNAIEKLTKENHCDPNHPYGVGYEQGLAEGKALLEEIGPSLVSVDSVKEILEQAYAEVEKTYGNSQAGALLYLEAFKNAALDKIAPTRPEELDQYTEREFTMRVTGCYKVYTKCGTYEEAERLANWYTQEADFGALENIEWEIVDVG